jgi:hypothetical protein
MVYAPGRRNGRSRVRNPPADLTHTGPQLFQLLRLEAHAHDAQAVADTGTDLTVELAAGHGAERLWMRLRNWDECPDFARMTSS